MPTWKRNLVICWFGSFVTMAGLSQISPILPLYIEQLGIHNAAAIAQWSGIAFGATFIVSAVFSPIWGQAADKYGRKLMLLRASLGMAIVIVMMGFVENVYQLVGLRLLMGAVSGFVSAAITLIATQTPIERSGWALGTLSTGAVSGMLVGPLIGGYIAETMGLRDVFFVTGGLLLVSFTASLFFVKELRCVSSQEAQPSFREAWNTLPKPKVVISMLITTFTMQLALMAIQPIITVYIMHLLQRTTNIALIAGVVVAASGLANILAAPKLGRIADAIGPQKVILVALIAAAIIFIPQAFVQNYWQLMGLQFLLGIASAGLLPAINTLVKRNTPDAIAGRIFGFIQSAQFLGTFIGSLLGGQIAAVAGIEYVFFFTSCLLLVNALWVYKTLYKLLEI